MENWTVDSRNNFLMYNTSSQDIQEMYTEYDSVFKTSNIVNGNTVYDKKESRLAGILGEIVFQHYLGNTAVRCSNLPYDYLYQNKKIDVKCKFRTVIPRPTFEASFFFYQSSNYFKDVDYYVFLSTITGYKTVWFCAWSDKNNWIHNPKGKLWKAGETDKTNGKVFHRDTWSVYYKDLPQLTDYYNTFK
jgi:hypothetical protein